MHYKAMEVNFGDPELIDAKLKQGTYRRTMRTLTITSDASFITKLTLSVSTAADTIMIDIEYLEKVGN